MSKKKLPQLVLYLLLFLQLGACSEPPTDHYQGYIEGEYLQIAPLLAGQLETLAVSRGQSVDTDTSLFTLEHALESAAVAEAEQELARSESQLSDLTKARRPSEIKAIEARLEQTKAALELARKEFDRQEELVKTQSVSRESYDRAASELRRTTAQVEEIKAELSTAGLGARSDVVAAARAEMLASRERLRQARWKLSQKSRSAPQGGLVFDTYYNPGEFVPAGYPVLSLLPPGLVKLRFFVPETVVATLQVGQPLSFTFDGAGRQYRATISYISPRAEYTPPVIYSRETRSKLVFLLEARPEAAIAGGLHPGQPVDVQLASGPERTS